MAARNSPPFRADHVGSLLRPQELLQARQDRAAGRISAAELRAKEDEAIRAAVKMQESVGLQGVTDGEFRRHDWVIDFKYQLGGVKKLQNVIKVPFQSESGNVDWKFVEYTVADRLKLDHVVFGDDFTFLRSITKATPKLTIPSPSMMHYPGGRGIDRQVYPDLELFFRDLAAAYAAEIAALGELGCTYLQIDDTSFAFLNDPKRRAMAGDDGETIHLKYIEVFNAAIAQRPPGMTVCTHLCRGNYRSAWLAQGSYEHVADALFNRLAADGFFLEYDDERSGGFEPLRFVPKGKMIVLGLVTTKKPALESKDELKRRIDQAAKFVPLEQLCLSPQCGFASTEEGNRLTIDEEIAKLRLVVETAQEVWG
jgi:5-methyltetrahydropteroyltriglutamate--homocysteine methyltransferase